MSKAHAEHNEQLCDFLIADGKFNDWVVTTAFYSSLHFVQNEMFPMDVTDSATNVVTNYHNFNSYYNAVLKAQNKSKHAGTKELVRVNIPAAFGQYRWLFDACMNARYSNYAISKQKAMQAKSNLTSLKSHLKK